MGIKNPIRKTRLVKKGRQTKWAPVWAVLRKFGVGKKVHPATLTRFRRNWRRNKLHMKPRISRPNHYG